MKKLIAIALLFSLAACSQIHESNKTAGASDTYAVDEVGNKVTVYIIDSCEYIGHIYSSAGDFLVHKGNCKFCEARKKKNQ